MTQNLHEDLTDSIVNAFFTRNEDLDIAIVICYLPDLGIKVQLDSDGEQMVLSGDTSSVTRALGKLIAKADKSISEHRAYKARIEKEFEAGVNGDDD